jgi:uncharacterized protein (DUF169 family)
MTDYRQFETRLADALDLTRRPVAIAFPTDAPESVPRFEGSVPSGCSFWRLAADGRTFVTAPRDHYNCPIGSYTHNIPLPEARQSELMGTLGLMTEIGYLRMEEVPGIPQLASTPPNIVYSPLGDAPLAPAAVILTGKPSRLMLLIEAAARAGVPSELPVLARPTCMAVPAALAKGIVTSAGCIGNRVYTDIGEDEMYVVLRGSDLEPVLDALQTIVSANEKLKEYHTIRRSQIATI